jgi:putative SOS response-associated peptidase YedK
MPVVLGPEHFEAWLDCKMTELKAAQEMLQPAPDVVLEAIEKICRSTIRGARNQASSSRCNRSCRCDLE